MAAHYFVGTGWGFVSSEPRISYLLRGDGTIADIDLQVATPDGQVVDVQLKAPGTLGLHDNVVDRHILEAVREAARQLPDPAVGPAFIVIGAQRGWPLSHDTFVLERMIGSTSCYQDGRLLLHEDAIGELAQWTHVSGIVMLDYVRSSRLSYACSVPLNPWAYYPSKHSWFPHARVLSCDGRAFKWHRGAPQVSTFGSRRSVARLAGPRR